MKGAEKKAREIAQRYGCGEGVLRLQECIASALAAERERALEDAEMAVSGYVALAAGPKHVDGLRKLIRAMKGSK